MTMTTTTTTTTTGTGTILVYAIHNGVPWWRGVGAHLGFDDVKIVSCIRGDGDFPLVAQFYPAYRRFYAARTAETTLIDAATLDDVIARCRVLRWLPRRKATAMALAMAEAMSDVLDKAAPRVVVSWPIDRYVSDILAQLALQRGIPYFELIGSPLLGRSLLTYRGQDVDVAQPHDAAAIESARMELSGPLFTPPLPAKARKYSLARFWKIFGYFKLRGIAFKAISIAKRDPLNLHYLDSQSFLGHKPGLRDYRAVTGADRDWRARYTAVPREKRLFIPLQVFPEASIDYWIADPGLVAHEDVLVEVAGAFSRAGYAVCVKDHPLQFGFRQVALLDRLRAITGVSVAPYDVDSKDILALTAVTFTCTGTLAMQSTMLGLTAIAAESYCTTTEDFVLLRDRGGIAELPARVAAYGAGPPMAERQARLAAKLYRASFPGDYMTVIGFRAHSDHAPLAEIGRNLGDALRRACAAHAARPEAGPGDAIASLATVD
jgi:hypothetical protein